MREVRGSESTRQNLEREEVLMHQDIEAGGWIERYLQGRLRPEELEQFEQHYFECDECLEQLELAEALQEGIRDVAAGEAGRFLGAPAREPARPWLSRHGQKLAAAALVVVGLGLGLLLPRFGEGLGSSSLIAPAVNTPVFFLGAERGASVSEPTTRIRPSPDIGGIVLALEVESPDVSRRFRASLHPQSTTAEPLWVGEDLAVDHNGTLSLSLPSLFLPPGDYWMSVVPMDGEQGGAEAGDGQRFLFRILPAN